MISRLLSLPLALVIFVSESRWEPYLWDAIFFGVGCLLVAISTVGRLWCSLYISGYKSRSLITVGPYSLCRNPLYLFSLCGAVGVGFTTETLTAPLVAGLAFALYYPAVVRAEEEKMSAVHGADYQAYVKSVPRFLPRRLKVSEPDQYVVNPLVYRKSMLDALWFVWLVGIIELAEAFREAGILPTLFNLY
ncbi:MAG: methyltransferase family protein [Candidatus Binatia bacterium]